MGSKQLVLMALTLVPIPFRTVRPLGILAPLRVLPESHATAAGNQRNCQHPPDYLNAVFPRLGNHILFFYRASRSSSSQLGKAGVEPKFQEWNGKGSLVAFVVSLNLHRRHLNESQRALVAARIANLGEGGRVILPQLRQYLNQRPLNCLILGVPVFSVLPKFSPTPPKNSSPPSNRAR